MPEFAHEDDIAAIRALFGRRPVWNNEDAYFVEGSEGGAEPTITAPSASAIELPEMTQAAYLVRGMLNQLAAGYSAVTHFDGIRNHSMFRDFWHVRPAAPAVAALTGILPAPEFQAKLTENTDNLRVLKWRNTAQDTVFSFWTLKRPEKIMLSGDVEIYDGFGNRVENCPTMSERKLSHSRVKAEAGWFRLIRWSRSVRRFTAGWQSPLPVEPHRRESRKSRSLSIIQEKRRQPEKFPRCL